MIQKEFAKQVVEKIRNNPEVVGLAAAGSWITGEMDEYSDLDLVLVTHTKLSDDKNKMTGFASQFGNLLNAFTGEHVGEPRVLICMFGNPLLHVDIKFITPEEFRTRVEDPVILWERDHRLSEIIQSTKPEWPALDFQWIEDRFWTWIHYATLKIGRGEYFEALDFLSFLRMVVIAPLLQLKNGKLPRGLRKVEFNFAPADLDKLISTVPVYEVDSIINSLENATKIYLELRKYLFPGSVRLNENLRIETGKFLAETKNRINTQSGEKRL